MVLHRGSSLLSDIAPLRKVVVVVLFVVLDRLGLRLWGSKGYTVALAR